MRWGSQSSPNLMDELQTRKGNRGRHQWCKGLAGRWCHASSGATTDKPTSEPHSCSNPSPGKRALSHGTVFQKKVLSDQSALKPASFDVFKRKRLPFFLTEPTFHCKNLLSFFPTPNQKKPLCCQAQTLTLHFCHIHSNKSFRTKPSHFPFLP